MQPPARSIGDVSLPDSDTGQNPANEHWSPPSPVGLHCRRWHLSPSTEGHGEEHTRGSERTSRYGLYGQKPLTARREERPEGKKGDERDQTTQSLSEKQSETIEEDALLSRDKSLAIRSEVSFTPSNPYGAGAKYEQRGFFPAAWASLLSPTSCPSSCHPSLRSRDRICHRSRTLIVA